MLLNKQHYSKSTLPYLIAQRDEVEVMNLAGRPV